MTCIHPQQEQTYDHAKGETKEKPMGCNIDRKFGIELELVGITREQAGRALSQVGIEVHDEGYNHTTRSYWKMVSDSSVRGGFELVSPVLRGEDGIHEARKVATALDDMGLRRTGAADTMSTWTLRT